MRRIISKLLILVMILNMLVLNIVFAEDRAMMYIDDGEGIKLAFADDKGAFIAPQQLYSLNLLYDDINNGIRIYNDANSLDAFMESNVIIKNGESGGFNDALYVSDAQVCGVNAALLCTVFGFEYVYDGECVRINTHNQEFTASIFSETATERTISGKVSLPNGTTASADTAVTVFIRDANKRNKAVASQNVNIALGQKTADFSLTVPEGVTRIILAYRLSDKSNLYGIGYYSENGTSIESTLAKIMTISASVADIVMYIIPTKKVTTVISMPNGATAADDIRANVYVVPSITYGVGSEYYSSSKTSEVIIQKGSTSGTAVFDVPLQSNVEYKLGVRFVTGDDSVFSSAYYGKDASVSTKHMATAVDDAISTINISLIPKNTISGTVINAQDACIIYAIGQDETGVKKKLTKAVFYTTGYSAEGTGAYNLSVPDDIGNYIIGFQYVNEKASQMRYYTENGLTTDISLASVLSVDNELSGIDILADRIYEGGPLKLYGYSLNHDNTLDVGYKNVSSVAQNGIHAMAAYYNENGALIGISKIDKSFATGECGTLHFDTSVLAGKTAHTVKVFAWEAGFVSTATKAKVIDWNVDTLRYSGIYTNSGVVFGENNKFVYTCNAIMAPIADAAAVFGTNVMNSGNTFTFTKGTTNVTFTGGSAIASVNGNDEMTEAVTSSNGTEVMVPIETLARGFGYNVYHNTINGILYITD